MSLWSNSAVLKLVLNPIPLLKITGDLKIKKKSTRTDKLSKVHMCVLRHVQLCNPMSCNLPGSVYGVSQARILQWVFIRQKILELINEFSKVAGYKINYINLLYFFILKIEYQRK